MNNRSFGILVVSLRVMTVSMFAQGSLTPPAAPTPTMKSLDQIEPRTPISSLPFNIANSGSYYLTKNVSVSNADGIAISASNVNLDLNGFTISSTVGSGTRAVYLNAQTDNITIGNGFIAGGVTYDGSSFNGAGFDVGIEASGNGNHRNVRASYISVLGVTGYGINLSGGNTGNTAADHCHVSISGGAVTASVITDSTADTIGGNAIGGGTVVNCSGQSIFGNAIFGGSVTNSNGTSTYGFGILATTVTNSYGTTTNASRRGIRAYSTVSFSQGSNSGSGAGIEAAIVIGCTASAASGAAVIGTTYLMP
jgi:hypothetical protein